MGTNNYARPASLREGSTRAGTIHTPRLVMLHEEINNLRGCQALMPVDRDGHVACSERVADVGV